MTKMRFLYTVAAGALAAIASAKDVTFDGPFFLTFVEKNGTEIPATIGEASRGIKILSAWNKYEQQFSYDG